MYLVLPKGDGDQCQVSTASTTPGSHSNKSEAPKSPHLSALTIAVLAVLLALLSYWIPGQRSPAPEQMFIIEHVKTLGIVDNLATRNAHKIALLALVILTGIAVVLRRTERPLPRWVELARHPFAPGWLGLLIIATISRPDDMRQLAQTFPMMDDSVKFLFQGVGLAALMLWMGRSLSNLWIRVLLWTAAVAYLASITLPGFSHPISLQADDWLEMHYSATVAQGDRLAWGLSLERDISLHYGLLAPLFLAIWERHQGMLDFAQHIRLVQISQAFFLLGGTLSLLLWRPRNALFLWVAVLLFGAYAGTSHMAVRFPNAAGWRTYGLVLGMLGLLASRRLAGEKRVFFLGCGAQFLILVNPETGISLTLGYGLFLLTRQSPQVWRQKALTMAATFAAGMVLSGLCTMLLFRLGLGYWPRAVDMVGLGFLGKFAGGFGASPLTFDYLAAIMFLHCAYNVAFYGLKWWKKPNGLNFNNGFLLAVSATILVWAAYYVNRPSPWGLWTYLYLYTFLLADFFSPVRLAHLRKRGVRAFTDFRLALIAFVILPAAIGNSSRLSGESLPSFHSKAPLVSGITMEASLSNSIHDRAAYLEQQDEDTLFFSIHSYSLSLMCHRFQPLPVQDALAETVTPGDFDALVDSVKQLKPPTILFDSLKGKDAPDNYCGPFYKRLQKRLTSYHFETEQSGWQVWRRNDST